MTKPKVSRIPPPLPAPTDEELVECTDPLVRVLRTRGSHLVAWNDLRTVGPIPGMRWEPHSAGPIGEHPSCGVSYQVRDLMAAVAEAYQSTRRIDPSTGAPIACHWTPARPLRLLDLTGTWPLRAGASSALMSAPRPVCCAYARAISQLPDLDGLHTRSTLTGGRCVVLFELARDAFPAAPDASYRLDSDLGLVLLDAISARIGYSLG